MKLLRHVPANFGCYRDMKNTAKMLLCLLVLVTLMPAWAKAEQTKKTINDIHVSIQAGDVNAVMDFLQQGNDINGIDDKGYTLLFYAIKHDPTDQVALHLLKHGADPNSDIGGRTPLMYAIKYQNYRIMEALFASGAKVNYVSEKQQSAPLYAIKAADVKALQMLLDQGADLQQKIMGEKTASDLAKAMNNQAIMSLLDLPYVAPSDGPYVTERATEREAVWLCEGQKVSEKVRNDVPQSISRCELSAKLWGPRPKPVRQFEYHGDFKVAAVSDIHGQIDLFVQLLEQHQILDEAGQWLFDDGHLVVTGDVFDRGPHVTEVLWLLYDLEQQAKKQGGRVHMLLGNHEVMVLNGDLRYLDPKYIDVATALDTPYDQLFAPATVLGDWLRSRPVVVKINGMLFLHGGIHPELVNKKLTIDQINTVFNAQLVASETAEGRDELGTFLHQSSGPIWYRGYFKEPLVSDVEIDQQLAHFGVQHIVIGHTSLQQIQARYNGKVIGIDAYMKGGETGEVLLWERGVLMRGLLTGERRLLLQD